MLHLIPSLCGGGAERQLTLLAVALQARGHDVHIGFTQDPSNNEMIASATAHRLASRGNHDPLLLGRVTRLLRSLRPDVVQTWLTQMDVMGGLAAWYTGTTWILSERSSEEAYPASLKHRIRRRLGRQADAVIANSAAGRDYWSRQSEKGIRVVIPNAVRARAPRIDRPPQDVPLVLFAGRLSAEKNVALLLAAVKLLHDERIAVLICGDGPEHDAISARVAQSGLADRVTVAGFRSDLATLMEQAAVLVSTSRFEGQPNTVLEAMACGCPLVLSRIPAHLAMVGSDGALLVDPDDPRALAACIREVLANPGAACERARCAHRRVATHSVEAVTDAYERIYSQVLSHRRNGHAQRVART